MTTDRGQVEQGDANAFAPSEEWLEAFEAQATEQVIERARRYATMRARGVAKVGGIADDFYVREVVQDAVTDTLIGTVRWDPQRTTLEGHLLDVIRFRTRHDRIRAKRYRHEVIDFAAKPRASARLVVEVERSLSAARDDDHGAAELVTRAMVELRGLAAQDPDVLRILGAYEELATKKVDVMRATKMSARQYENARKRLVRFVQQLSTDVREAARARA